MPTSKQMRLDLQVLSARWVHFENVLEDMHLDREVFLRILSESFQQIPRLDQHGVRIVIESFVFKQLASRALARLQFRSEL
jgi:hypothetical protein